MTATGAAAGSGPLLSIVMPVGAVAAFLPACLDSVLGQPAPSGGAEVIAVDDAAGDGSGEILDARAAADPRLRVIHLATRGGPGPARMRGLAKAAGAYVWFVDPDDLLAEGAVEEVAKRLQRDRPDVLLIDYLIMAASGATEPSPGAALLAPATASGLGGTFALADRPALLSRTMTSWSKVIRRPFLASLGVAFRPGIHEDVPVSCAVLLGAERIAVTDRVCYVYRRRAGSFLATPGTEHFSIFSSYEQVFALAGMTAAPSGPGSASLPPGRVITPDVRLALFARALEHYTTILASGLVPRAARRDFFARMVADYRRYRPPGYRRPPGPRGAKMMLIERDAFWAYRLLVPLNRARVVARRAVGGRGTR